MEKLDTKLLINLRLVNMKNLLLGCINMKKWNEQLACGKNIKYIDSVVQVLLFYTSKIYKQNVVVVVFILITLPFLKQIIVTFK